MKKIAALIALFAAAHANASLISFQTGYSAAGPQATAEAYRDVVEAAVAAPGAGYGVTNIASYNNISNQSIFGGSYTNVAFKSTIQFGVQGNQAGTWTIRAGVDFGRGGAIFLDGQAVAFRNTDMWWAGNYNNPSQYFQFSGNIAAGNHTLTVYGLENCCDGGQQIQYNFGQGFQSFNNQTLNPVPEPETYALLLAGLGAVGMLSRRRQQKLA
ncbi:CCXG family PEP-CTERM protein [Massilia sp. W12]|uniref:CCXG family PEP-CTERM protein n=1 Tax=Massilia sp. W12 TaxID=3126507 RepID=UPI0030D4EEDD